MMRSSLAAIPFAMTLVLAVSTAAEAKRHGGKTQKTKTVIIIKSDDKLKNDMAEMRRELAFFRELARGPSVLGTIPVGLLDSVVLPPVKTASLGPVNVQIETPRDLTLKGVTTDSLPLPLKGTLLKVQAACEGFRVISACRPGARVRGSGRVSLHASCRAADFTVSRYSCAYGVLKGFPGGVSTDPGRVNHIHVSYSPKGREWGRHFAHWQPGHRRYARRHGRQYARA